MPKRDAFPDNGFEQWGGYMNAKIAKLDEQYNEKFLRESNKSSNIFADVSIFVNGYTNPSADQLKCLMSEHGGIYHHYFRSNITKFIIASNLPDTKVKNLPTTKIVKPEWITDSIKMGTLLDFKEYLLYSNHSKTQPRLNFKNSTTTVCDSNDESVKSSNESKISRPIIESSNDNAKTRTANDPKFLDEFYNNSRLHHISQMGATFKQYINELRSASDFVFPARENIRKNHNVQLSLNDTDFDFDSKVIMHIDMDCFFVSVGLRSHPHLKGKPVAVTHSKGAPNKKSDDLISKKKEFEMYNERRKDKLKKFNPEIEVENEVFTWKGYNPNDAGDSYSSMSEIASCSYEARALGLRNGMFMGTALRLCPNLKTIPYDFEGYKEVAYALYDTVAQYTLDIEAVSCDEMYVDCTSLLNDTKLSPMEFATVLRDEIFEKTNCTCSTGFGENRLQARLATKKAKPNGQFYLTKENVEAYFADISLGDLPGIGRQMESKLKSLGFTTCQSLRSTNLNYLKKHFGNKTGQLLHQQCRGQDPSPLNFNMVRKSISAGVNYGIRFADDIQCETFLKQLCHEIHNRMLQNKVMGKSLTLKLMVRAAGAPVETAKFMGHGLCDNITKTVNLTEYTNSLDVIEKEILEMTKNMNAKPEDMRGISIQMSKLQNSGGTVDNSNRTDGGIKKFMTNKAEGAKINENKTFDQFILKKSVFIKSPVKQNNVENIVLNKPKMVQTAKRRGRPPKHTLIENATNSILKTNKLKTFLNPEKNSTNSENNEIDFTQLNIDREVFLALPDDIKQELMNDLRTKRPNIVKSNQNIVQDNKKKLHLEKKESGITISTAAISEENSFSCSPEFDMLNLEWTEVREIFRVWIKSSALPLACDIKLIDAYLKNLITSRKIEDAKYLVSFVYRITSQVQLCVWHKVYTKMVNVIQENMMSTYGKKMSLKNTFDCCEL